MWIIDFRANSYTKSMETKTFSNEREVIQFIINASFNANGNSLKPSERIEIVHIRKYENGQLRDYRATIDVSGFHLKQIPLDGSSKESRTEGHDHLFR